MHDSANHTASGRARRHREYEDPHCHDDDLDDIPADDAERRGTQPPPRRQGPRRPLPRRYFDD